MTEREHVVALIEQVDRRLSDLTEMMKGKSIKETGRIWGKINDALDERCELMRRRDV